MDFALKFGCSASIKLQPNQFTMAQTQISNSSNTLAVVLGTNQIVERCFAKMATDVTLQVRDKLIDIILAVLARECEDFDVESVRRLILAEIPDPTVTIEKRVKTQDPETKTKTKKTVELDADGNPVKRARKEKAPKAPKVTLSEEEKAALKAEKEAAKAAADARAISEGVSPILSDAQKTLEAAQPTLDAVQKLAETSERLLGKVAELKGPPTPPDPNAPPAKPFDIADYQKMLGDATVALGEANKLLSNADSLAGSKSIKGLIDEVTHATEQRIESLEAMVMRVVYLIGGIAAGIVVLTFALLFAYRATAARTVRTQQGGMK